MKKIIFAFCLLFSFVIFFSCNEQKKEEENPESKLADWDRITINVDNGFFNIDSEEDSAIYYSYNDSVVYFDSTSKETKNKRIFIEVPLTKEIKDSIFKICYREIRNPKFFNVNISCYAGDYLNITIKKGNSSISVKYSSTISWDLISLDMKKLKSMTFDKIKN